MTPTETARPEPTCQADSVHVVQHLPTIEEARIEDTFKYKPREVGAYTQLAEMDTLHQHHRPSEELILHLGELRHQSSLEYRIGRI